MVVGGMLPPLLLPAALQPVLPAPPRPLLPAGARVVHADQCVDELLVANAALRRSGEARAPGALRAVLRAASNVLALLLSVGRSGHAR